MSEPWSVHIPCPQCGAPVDLDAGDPILACEYCRTRLYLASRGPLRYRLPPDSSKVTSTPIVHLPFWRFRGLRYRVLDEPARVERGLLDATVPAYGDALPRLSLGIRPQVMALSLDRGGENAVPTERTAGKALLEAGEQAESFHGTDPLFTRLVGETICLVLAPYALERRGRQWRLREVLPDGVAHPLNSPQAEAIRAVLGRPSSPDPVTLLPLMCPECGHDLPTARGAVGLLCGRCARAWWVRGNRFAPLPYAIREADRPGARYFPFWQVAFRAEGLPISNRAELRRWAVSYQPVPPGWDREPCQLLVPGFKLQPRTFLRMARIMSLAPLEIPGEARVPSVRFEAEPVRLPLSEAAQALRVILARLARDNLRAFSAVEGVRLRVRRARIVYLPYHLQGSEWIEEESGTAVQAVAVSHGTRI